VSVPSLSVSYLPKLPFLFLIASIRPSLGAEAHLISYIVAMAPKGKAIKKKVKQMDDNNKENNSKEPLMRLLGAKPQAFIDVEESSQYHGPQHQSFDMNRY
jgi:hypothetical protein